MQSTSACKDDVLFVGFFLLVPCGGGASQDTFKEHDVDGARLLMLEEEDLRAWGLQRADLHKLVGSLQVLRELNDVDSDFDDE